jgi:hypothetical protein
MYYTFPAFAKAALLKKKAEAKGSESSEGDKEAEDSTTRLAAKNSLDRDSEKRDE